MAILQPVAAELVGQVPGLSFLLAQTLVERAWEEILKERRWSFLVAEGQLLAPGSVTAGTVTVTQFSKSVVGDATAAAAWQAISPNTPITAQQFRVGTGGPLYNITAFDGSSTLTLDRFYGESSGAAQTYQVYQCYFSPPSTDFKRWVSVGNPVQGYPLVLNKMKAEIDIKDPQRGAQGDAYWVAQYKADANGNPLYELWPHPTNAASYLALYERNGQPLTVSDILPAAIPKGLLTNRALHHAYMWAMAQAAINPTSRNPNWNYLLQNSELIYAAQLKVCKRNDEETFLQTFSPLILRGRPTGYWAPISADFAQTHDVDW